MLGNCVAELLAASEEGLSSMELCDIIILYVFLYGCESWYVAQSNQQNWKCASKQGDEKDI
jgi:hypothetical protein